MFQVIFILFDWILIKQIYYKMNLIKDSFQRFCQYFKSTYDWLFLEAYAYCFTQKMCVSKYVCKISHKENDIFLQCWETFE